MYGRSEQVLHHMIILGARAEDIKVHVLNINVASSSCGVTPNLSTSFLIWSSVFHVDYRYHSSEKQKKFNNVPTPISPDSFHSILQVRARVNVGGVVNV